MALNSIMPEQPMITKKVVPASATVPSHTNSTDGHHNGGGHEKTRKLASQTKTQIMLRNVLDNKWFNGVMVVITIFALVGDDFRIAYFPKDADPAFEVISFIALICFTCELITTCIVKQMDYIGKFYFWLDVLSTLSLMPDVPFIWEPINDALGANSNAPSTTLKVGKASRASAKAGRIVRIVRLVRLIRIAKLFKAKSNAAGVDDNPDEPSNVGKKTCRTYHETSDNACFSNVGLYSILRWRSK